MTAFTVTQRDEFCAHVLRMGQDHPAVVAGALVGSLARNAADAYSDVDLTFAVADGTPVAQVVDDWTETLVSRFEAVGLADLTRGPTEYRVFLLPHALQLDLSMSPASEFRPTGPHFRLIFGETASTHLNPTPSAGSLFIDTPAVASEMYGWGVIYALHARACIKRRRVWQAEHYVAAVRDHALSMACRRLGVTVVQARGYDDLPTELQRTFEPTLVGALEPELLARALAAAVQALLVEGAAAQLPSAAVVAARLENLF